MKLISCYIAHFGKINEFSYTFEDGFNSILEENGWGKTTFSVFMKAMFYGLEYSPNTKKRLLERNHYLPWDGSVCGGNIVFRVNGKDYRIERTFGKTDRDDTFALYNNITGIESDDYSQDIGEELFRVDRDSFEKSVYIPQLAVATAMTDSLNAKMGNLAAAKDDISNFDVALKSVKDARINYTRNSKINPGKLFGVKQEINKLKEEYEKLPAIEEGVEARSLLLNEKQDNLDKLTAEKAKLTEIIQLQSKREQELGAYKTYQETLKQEQEKLSELDKFFAAGIPDDNELAVLEQTEHNLAVHKQALRVLKDGANKAQDVVKAPFKNYIPDDSEFDNWNKMAGKLSELRAKAEHSKLSEEASRQLGELKYFFDKMVPTDEQLKDIEDKTVSITGIEARIDKSNEKLITLNIEKAANDKNMRHSSITVWHILGTILLVILILIGVVFARYIDSKMGQIVEIVSIGAIILGLASLAFSGRRAHVNKRREETDYFQRIAEVEEELEEARRELEGDKKECEAFLSNFLLTRADTMQENVYEIRRKLDQYKHLLDEEAFRQQESEGTLDALADVQLELYTKIQPFATHYNINLYESGEEYKFLAMLKKDADKYVNYIEEQEQISRHENAIKTMLSDIESVLSRYPVDKTMELDEQIHLISNRRKEYQSISDKIAQLQEAISAFEEKYGINEQVQSVDALQQQQTELDEQIMDLSKQILQEKEDLSQALEEVEKLTDIAEQLERLEVQEKEYKKNADLLMKTEDLLQSARESFLTKYMQPLQDGLHKYLSLIDGPDGTKSGYDIGDFELDMDLNIKLTYSGSTKGAEYLSQGYQDLVALSSRLALVDVLYPEEKPILILDDPFTNLDDKKIKESLKLLRQIAADRQTIYFTCHESRM